MGRTLLVLYCIVILLILNLLKYLITAELGLDFDIVEKCLNTSVTPASSSIIFFVILADS